MYSLLLDIQQLSPSDTQEPNNQALFLYQSQLLLLQSDFPTLPDLPGEPTALETDAALDHAVRMSLATALWLLVLGQHLLFCLTWTIAGWRLLQTVETALPGWEIVFLSCQD